MTRVYSLISVLLCIVCLSACQPQGGEQRAVQPAAEAELELGDFDVEQYRGQVVYLDFWASWCPPCLASFPWMNQLHKDLSAQGLAIVAVNIDSDQAAAADFLAKTPADFEIVYDPMGMIAEQYNVTAMPSSFIFNAEGELLSSMQGFNSAKALKIREQLQQLLATVQPHTAAK